MISENKTVHMLINNRTFKTNLHKLANGLRISDLDAQQELLVELITHKLKHYSDAELQALLLENNVVLNWKITYAARNVFRNNSKKHAKERILKDELITHYAESHTTKLNIDMLVNELSEINLKPRTKSFILSVFENGKQETQVMFQMNDEQ